MSAIRVETGSRANGRARACTLVLSIALIGLLGCEGEHAGPGEVTQAHVPADEVAARADRVRDARASLSEAAPPAAASEADQILFGDLHVHTTFSPDAFIISIPMMGGDGAHPPADACDFARFCSGLDFWSINDHAEGITPRRWAETRESIRQCNAVAGDPENPDTVALLGWEWSQVSLDPDQHYGHKNVIFRDTDDDSVPARAIAASRDQIGKAPIGRFAQLALAVADWENRDSYFGIQRYYDEIQDTPPCEAGVDTRELPASCLETAADPRELFEKLDEWGFPSLVIPHGNAWGLMGPPGVSFDKQLNREQHDPDRQILFEIFSGHGSSEEFRPFTAVLPEGEGDVCPVTTSDYEPCCFRAGEIIRDRCDDEGGDDCDERAHVARENFAAAGVAGYWTVPGAQVDDWKGCGQCTDCFSPAFDYRPRTTAQYALALSDLSDPADPLRFRFGFIGSSDVHRGRPGTGYKEFARRSMTDVSGPQTSAGARITSDGRDPVAHSERYVAGETELPLARLRNTERQSSFWMTGGLVAAHADGRDRDAVWRALSRKSVYATSGDRILLWFDLIDADGTSTASMGSATHTPLRPRFRVRAAGSFEQKPGCPESSVAAIGDAEIERLCRGECYHPSDERRRITRIEVVRIRPRISLDEPIEQLVEDPWRVFECPAQRDGCLVEFEDDDAEAADRETLYYVRAIQEPTPAINGDQLRCRFDESGTCVEVEPCYGDVRTSNDDDCLAPIEQRAWSSPIYLVPEPD